MPAQKSNSNTIELNISHYIYSERYSHKQDIKYTMIQIYCLLSIYGNIIIGNTYIKTVVYLWCIENVNFSLLRQTSPYFQRCEIFFSCTSARQKKSRAFYRQMHAVQFMSTAPQFSMLFLFKINNWPRFYYISIFKFIYVLYSAS